MDKVKPFLVQRILIIASHMFWKDILKRQMEAKEFDNV